MAQMTNIALIVAAGRGSRAQEPKSSLAEEAPGSLRPLTGQAPDPIPDPISGASFGITRPKQYQNLAGLPVLGHTLKSFLTHRNIDEIVVVIHDDDRALYDSCIDKLKAATLPARCMDKLCLPVIGGESRAKSVRNGLNMLSSRHFRQSGSDASSSNAPGRLAPRECEDDTKILIHDAARPLLTHKVIDRVLAAIRPGQGAIAALPVSDTLKQGDTISQGDSGVLITATHPRDGVWYAQTPQGFRLADINEAYQAADREKILDSFTDDAAVAVAKGLAVSLVEGAGGNIKITYPEDFTFADFVIRQRAMSCTEKDPASSPAPDPTPEPASLPASRWQTRIGQGVDVHGYEPGDEVILCGVKIPFHQRLKGHSDADVALHALTDALLGAIGAGDIGDHFPPEEPEWRGAASEMFLRHAVRLIAEAGGRIVNCDLTLICEAPRIGPHRAEMRANIADIMNIDVARVSVKATTTEGLGFTGRKEGICAMASASVMLPADEI